MSIQKLLFIGITKFFFKAIIIVSSFFYLLIAVDSSAESFELTTSLEAIEQLMQKEQYEKALVAATLLTEQYPHFPPLQEKLFEIYLKLNFTLKAEKIYQHITNRFQNNATDYLTAQFLFAKGDLETAEKFLQKVIQLNARNIPAIILLIEIYKEKQYFHLVEKYLAKIKDIDPYHRDYLYEKIIFLIKQEYSIEKNVALLFEIEKLLETYYQKHSQDYRYFYLESLLAFQKKEYEKSLLQIEKAIALNPIPYYFQFKLELLFQLKKWQEFIFFLKYYQRYWPEKDIIYLKAVANFFIFKDALNDHSLKQWPIWQLIEPTDRVNNKGSLFGEQDLRKEILFPLRDSIEKNYYEYNDFLYTTLLLENLPNQHNLRIKHANFLLQQIQFFEKNNFIFSTYLKKILRLAPLNFEIRKAYLEHLILMEHYVEALNQIYLLKKIYYRQTHQLLGQSNKQNNFQLKEKKKEYFYLQTLAEKILHKRKNTIATKHQLNPFYLDSVGAQVLLICSETKQKLAYPFFPELIYRELYDNLVLAEKISLTQMPENEFNNSVISKKYQVYVICRYLPLLEKNYHNQIAIEVEIYRGSTQLLLEKFVVTTSGKHKVLYAVKEIKDKIEKYLQFYGQVVLKTNQGIIIDWGNKDNITKETEFIYNNISLKPLEIDENFTLIEMQNDIYLQEVNVGDRIHIILDKNIK